MAALAFENSHFFMGVLLNSDLSYEDVSDLIVFSFSSLKFSMSFFSIVFREQGEFGSFDDHADFAKVISEAGADHSHHFIDFTGDGSHCHAHSSFIFVIHQEGVV